MLLRNSICTKGFTLSEVLLVLSVIGIIAALTIPTLIQKANSAQNVSQLKKTYSALSQAFNMLISDNGGDIADNAYLWSGNSMHSNVMNAFATKMNFIKTCIGADGECWYTNAVPYLNTTLGMWSANPDAKINAKAVLSDGTMLMFDIYSGFCTYDYSTINDGNPLDAEVCGAIIVDVNGKAGPNMRGRDVFSFFLTQSGVYPNGVSYVTSVGHRAIDCNPTDAVNGSGYGCAAKVLSEGAFNY